MKSNNPLYFTMPRFWALVVRALILLAWGFVAVDLALRLWADGLFNSIWTSWNRAAAYSSLAALSISAVTSEVIPADRVSITPDSEEEDEA